ncbi:Phospholipid metabolism protein [Blastocladiella emersonii ATCC 22665]|nr:Phospholipid metabolism protein [Blastocladiella emersonii ATCC 22665]
MKVGESNHVYERPWGLVTAALWQKYPSEKTPHVLSVDVVDQHVDEERRVLHTHRLLTIRQQVPRLLVKLFGGREPVSYVLEVSQVDLATQTFSAVSTNLTFRDLMVMSESVHYSPDAGHPSARTAFRQTVTVSTSVPARIADYIEGALIQRFQANAHLGRAALDQVMERLAAVATGASLKVAAASP